MNIDNYRKNQVRHPFKWVFENIKYIPLRYIFAAILLILIFPFSATIEISSAVYNAIKEVSHGTMSEISHLFGVAKHWDNLKER